MPYTRAWDEAQPLGSAQASTIDDIIRALKVDLRERLNALVVDFTADPVVPNPATSGAGLSVIMHWSAGDLFVAFLGGDVNTEAAISRTELGVGPVWDTIGATRLSWIMPLMLPIGTVFNAASVRVYRDATASVSYSLRRVNQNTGSITTFGTVASASTGWHDLPVDVSAGLTVEDGYAYYGVVTLAVSDGTNFARLQNQYVRHT